MRERGLQRGAGWMLVLGISMLPLAGCGDRSAPKLESVSPAVAQQVGRLCRHSAQQLTRARRQAPRKRKTVAAAMKTLERLGAVLQRLSVRVRALSPANESDRRATTTYADDIAEEALALQSMATAVSSGDKQALAKIRSRIAKAASTARADAARAGFVGCGQPAATTAR